MYVIEKTFTLSKYDMNSQNSYSYIVRFSFVQKWQTSPYAERSRTSYKMKSQIS